MNAIMQILWNALKANKLALLACLVFLAAPSIGLAYDIHPITDSTTNNANIDVAVDADDIPHAVYDRGGSVYYKNCDAARAAGAAPVYAGQPGYGTHLDRDRDGIGCE